MKKIYLRDFLIGIICFPIICLATLGIDLFFTVAKPFLMSYLQMRGVDIFTEIDPVMTWKELIDYAKKELQ